MNKILDFTGKQVNIGDKVAWTNRMYAALREGVVTKLTAKRMYVSHTYPNNPKTYTNYIDVWSGGNNTNFIIL